MTRSPARSTPLAPSPRSTSTSCADAGLLASRFERVSGRSGPGAGRPAKLYRRADREIELSLPPRRYDLAAAMLADAVSRAEGASLPLSSVLAEAAGERGEQVGRAHAREHRRDALTTVKAILEANGYEPRRIGSALALLNCPFHHLAEEHRALVCGMNRDFLTGVIKGAGAESALARAWHPRPGTAVSASSGTDSGTDTAVAPGSAFRT